MRRGLLVFGIFLLFLLNFVSAVPLKNATFENVNITNDLIVGHNASIVNNLEVGQNISATGGFFEFLGTSVSRIMNGWFTSLNVVNLVVDTNTLFVDSTNNRVGIGTTTPTQELEVNGSVNITEDLSLSGLGIYNEFIHPSYGNGIRLNANEGARTIAFMNDSNVLISDPDTGLIFDVEDVSQGGGWGFGVGRLVFWTRHDRFPEAGISFINGESYDFLVDYDAIGRTFTISNPINNPDFDTLFYANVSSKKVGINTDTPQNPLNIIGETNSTGGFIVGPNTGITANFSVGNCWVAFSGGIAYSSNCTEI